MPGDPVPQASADPFPVRRAQVQANGASFHVIEQGQGPAVLFCHGFPDTAETWRSQMRAVAEAGYRAVALDMRGFGASYAPSDVSLYSALHTVGDLVSVLDALDIRSAILVGHDWGADVAQRAMVMRPDRFRSRVHGFTCKRTLFRSGRCWFRTSDLCRVKAGLGRSSRTGGSVKNTRKLGREDSW